MSTRRLDADEPLPGTNGAVVGDFWSWAYSNPLQNVERGVLAEFLVGHALGVVGGARIAWDAYDLVYRGQPIEVKSSAYVQAWDQPRPSPPSFGIGEAGAWAADGAGPYDPERRRRAVVYVFALYGEQDRDRAMVNVLDANAWEFYVLPTQRINSELGSQKSVGIGTLRRLTEKVRYPDLKARVDGALSGSG